MVVKTLISAEQFLEIVEREGPCDLIRGEVVPLTRAGFNHNRIVGNLTKRLGLWAEQSDCGRVLPGDTGIVLARDPDSVRGADFVYLSYAALPKDTSWSGFLNVAPDLVVEVLGVHKGWQDAIDKTGEYLKFGVKRVWLVDPVARTVHVYQSDRAPIILDTEQTISDSEVLPDFSCRVAEFFKD